ncbi:hypothetical protein ACQWHU_24675, partial [Salmonella enterica subsp. enterica serovar Infantis]
GAGPPPTRWDKNNLRTKKKNLRTGSERKTKKIKPTKKNTAGTAKKKQQTKEIKKERERRKITMNKKHTNESK